MLVHGVFFCVHLLKSGSAPLGHPASLYYQKRQHHESSVQPGSLPTSHSLLCRLTSSPSILHLVAKSDGNCAGPYIL